MYRSKGDPRLDSATGSAHGSLCLIRRNRNWKRIGAPPRCLANRPTAPTMLPSTPSPAITRHMGSTSKSSACSVTYFVASRLPTGSQEDHYPVAFEEAYADDDDSGRAQRANRYCSLLKFCQRRRDRLSRISLCTLFVASGVTTKIGELASTGTVSRK